MLAISTEFLQAIKNKAPQDVRFEFSNGSVVGTSDIAITSSGLNYTEILNGETDVVFGRAVMAELSAVLINADGRFTNFDFSREFTAKIGVKVDGAFEYIALGVFKGVRPDKVRGKLIEFTAHDRMSLFDRPAESFVSGLTFPCTLGQIFTKLCDFCGVGYDSASFPNSGKTFDKNPLEDTDYTCREILGYIAEAAGSYARMSRDGAVELVWFASADYTVTRTDRFEMTESEFLTPSIDRLEVYNSYGDQLNTSGTGDIVYGISDNPFLYIENDTQLAGLQPYVDVIYNRITSLPAYHPSSFRAEFNPAVQCGDVISVVDDYGETISFPVFVQTITWAGFGKATYENTGGVIRQNAPFTQRELEQLKKKSVKTKDLWTYIDSYMNSEEGVASINAAVGGIFVTEDQISGFITETELNAGVEAYINGAEGIAKLTDSLSGVFVTTGEYNKSVHITASSQVFVKAAGASSYTPSSITLTAETKGTGLTFQWYLNDTAISGATGTTLTITSDSFSGSSAAYKIVATDSAGNTFTDIISIAKLADGKDGVNGTNGKDGVNGTNGKDGVNGVDGKSLRQITTQVRSQTLATVQSWVGLQKDIWSGIIIGDFNVGDTCLIAINVTDKGGVTGYMRCEILGYNASTKVLTTNNLDFMLGADGKDGANGEKGDKGDTGAAGKDGANGKDGVDGYTILLSNEFIEVPVNQDRKPTSSNQYTCTVSVYKGLTALSDFTVEVSSLPTGVSATVSGTAVTIKVTTGSAIADTGNVMLKITAGSMTLYKSIVVRANTNALTITGYQKTVELDADIERIIDRETGLAKLRLSASENTTTEISELDVGEPDDDFLVGDGETDVYPFTTRDMEGYYTSQNAGNINSCSYMVLRFNFSAQTEVTFRCICLGETNYDYGLISNVDCDLTVSYKPDDNGGILSSDVFYSFRGQHSVDPVDVVMTIPAGSHYVTIKYVKDSSTDASGDYFKFRAFASIVESTTAKSTITLTQNDIEIASADIKFTGFVTFESLSTPGATTIDGGNINTDNLYVKQVYLDDGKNSQPILHSELEENGSGEVFLGFREYMANPANPHILKIYAKDIYLMQPGDNEDSKNTLRFSMTTRRIIGNATWFFDELSV